jgi:capsular exopolysaccharide synthesis family protein
VENPLNKINQRSEVDEVKKFISNMLGNWYWIVLSLAIALGVAFLINRYTKPVYSVYTTILSQKYYKSRSSRTMDVIQGSEYFATQKDINWEVSVLKSYKVVTETIRRLNWDVFYYQSGNVRVTELYPSSPVRVVTDTSSNNIPYGVMIDCQVIDANTFRLKTEHEYWKNVITDRSYPFDAFNNLDGWVFNITKDRFLKPESVISFTVNDLESLVGQYRGKLQVGWLAKGSAVLKLSLTGETPKKEMDFLSEIAQVIDEQSIITKNEAAVKTIDFINEQLSQLSDSLVSASKVMQRYKLQNRDLTLGSQNIFSKINVLEEEKYQLQLTNHYLDYLQDYIRNKSEHEVIAPNTIGVEASLLNNLIIEYVNLRMSERTRVTDFIKKSPYYAIEKEGIEDQLKEYEESILESIQTSRERNNFNIREIDDRINTYLAGMGGLLSQERELTDVQKIFNLNEQFYVMLLTEKVTASIAKASQESDYAVLDTPRLAGPAIAPRKGRNYTYAIVIGLGLPIGLFYLIGFLNPYVVSKDDLDRHTDMPLLGLVGHDRSRTVLVAKSKSKSSIAESFRNLRANLQYFLKNGSGSKTILVTSSVSGEGKTFCSANLAYIYAISGKKTLVLGADLRKPALSKVFRQKNSRGLSSYLAGMCEYDALGENVITENLFVIHSGHVPPNPSELLVGERMALFVEKIKKDYEVIIIDSPPIGIVSDSLELTQYADINTIIVRQGTTKKSSVDVIHSMYKEGKIRNTAVIFNDIDFSRTIYGHKYGYGKRYGYGYGYGYGDGYGYYDDEPVKKRTLLARIFRRKKSKS